MNEVSEILSEKIKVGKASLSLILSEDEEKRILEAIELIKTNPTTPIEISSIKGKILRTIADLDDLGFGLKIFRIKCDSDANKIKYKLSTTSDIYYTSKSATDREELLRGSDASYNEARVKSDIIKSILEFVSSLQWTLRNFYSDLSNYNG